jgi:regulator of cell morphogenesis and NO signaling
MFFREIDINDDTLVTDIVTRDYRTSAVFRKYGIEFCCTGRVPLRTACEMNGLDKEIVKKELHNSVRNIQISNAIDFNSWDIDFLIDYIKNVHHSYLQKGLPDICETLESFVEGHQKKFPWLLQLMAAFTNLKKILLPHLEHEEQVIFPYIKQISHAYNSHEPYAALLVRTLRKPVEELMHREHQQVRDYLHLTRDLTDNYTIPSQACVTHQVCFLKLQELDNELVQHTHLENNILFPRALSMEKELLRGE